MVETPSQGIPKEQFLALVRQALGRAEGPPEPPYPSLAEDVAALETQAAQIRRRSATETRELLDRLAVTAQLRGWQVHRAASAEEAVGYITAVAQALGVQRVVRSDHEVLLILLVQDALEALGMAVTAVVRDQDHSREALRQAMAEAGLGITGADYAVAETGSVVLLPRRGLSRLVSLVPPVHLAVVRPQEVVATLDDVLLLRRLEYYRDGGDMGSYLNFITGPSRTADIEQTLVVGVHGPREVHLVLLDEKPPLP
jgi:L-lactate dehydrogenase complex protein LldG